MCQFVSLIITKDNEYYLHDVDSHEQIIDKFGFRDDGINPQWVRVELIPKRSKTLIDTNPSNWDLAVDQDYIPDWYNEEGKEKIFTRCWTRVLDKINNIQALTTLNCSDCHELTTIPELYSKINFSKSSYTQFK